MADAGHATPTRPRLATNSNRRRSGSLKAPGRGFHSDFTRIATVSPRSLAAERIWALSFRLLSSRSLVRIQQGAFQSGGGCSGSSL